MTTGSEGVATGLGLNSGNAAGEIKLIYSTSKEMTAAKSGLPERAVVGWMNRVAAKGVNARGWKMVVNPKTGVFEGSFQLGTVGNGDAKSSKRLIKFAGVLHQGDSGETEVGAGTIFLPTEDGTQLLSEPLRLSLPLN